MTSSCGRVSRAGWPTRGCRAVCGLGCGSSWRSGAQTTSAEQRSRRSLPRPTVSGCGQPFKSTAASGVYYATGGAALEFWDPRSGSWPPFDGRVEAVPEPGTVVCFPNWEVHGVVRTHSVTPRVSVAFNVAHPPDHHEAPGATSLFTTSHVSAGDRPVLSSTLPSSGVAHLWATPVLREHVRLEEKSLVASIEAAASSLLDSSSCVVRVTALPDYRSQQSVLGSPRPRGAALHGYYRHPVPTESSPPPPVVQMYDPRSAGYRDTTFLGQLVWHARPGELMLCPGWVPWEVLPPRDYRTGRAPPMRGAAGRHSGQWVSVVSREPAEDSVVVCSGAEEGAMLSLGRGGERRLNASAAPPPSLALVEVACPDGWALADAHRAASSAVHADGPQGIGSRDVERQGGGALGDAVRAVLTRWDNDRDGVWSLSEARAASRNGMAAGKWGVEGLCTPASDLWPELTCIVTLRDLQGWYSRHQQALAGDRQVSRATTVFALAFA
eukprot:TRINITY_DN18215_c0_g1_i1.p1 TRINITY_DN18215_c0_g1~~TRINITY_DN18215_c0_g1_i1.p1  ORF type:complete len:496 (+),score=68.98 TRINITY_DN18215_c0_g1_i1:253-1740(+)